MQIIDNPSKEDFNRLCQRPDMDRTTLTSHVTKIINHVKDNGDSALKKYSAQFDNIELESIEVTTSEISGASTKVPDSLKTAIKSAISNVYTFHKSQNSISQKIETVTGVTCWQKNVPIEKVGLYIPGGSAPLISTVIMLGVPAIIAGCEEIIVCSPPSFKGTIDPAILHTCSELGINQIFKAGGAQAIAAMAFGTESIPRVFKVFGPGNQYVTMAKQILQRKEIAIDLPAGPSEVLVFADETTNADFIAADLLAQAEHGPDSQVMLVTTDHSSIAKVKSALDSQIADLPKKNIAAKALENSKLIYFDNKNMAIEFTNHYAPEHLIVMTLKPHQIAEKIKNAGSVFLGEFTPESAGDYASGTNHTLPTNGYARMYGGISLHSFYKTITYQEISRTGLQNLFDTICTLATAEDLMAHRRAVEIRLNDSKE